MSTVAVAEQIKSLHAAFNQLVPESECVLNMNRESTWYAWIKWRGQEHAFTAEDLAMVVVFTRAQIKSRQAFPAQLRFSYLVGNPDYFEESLSMAKHAKRHARDNSDRASVLRATGRTPPREPVPDLYEVMVMDALKKLKASVNSHLTP
jgi:hypothetical protein